MPDLAARATDLFNSLDGFKPTERPDDRIARMFDAVVAQAKEEHPDDPVINGLAPIKRNAIGHATATAGELRAVLQHMLTALR
jgi:hypothetical protein